MSKSTTTVRERLVALYQEAADLTSPECASACRLPRSCCSPEYCEIAIAHAREDWGVELARTGHTKLPLMGPEGCMAAPHLRPMCALHSCGLNAFGIIRGDARGTRTKRYFEVRAEIERLVVQIEDAEPTILDHDLLQDRFFNPTAYIADAERSPITLTGRTTK